MNTISEVIRDGLIERWRAANGAVEPHDRPWAMEVGDVAGEGYALRKEAAYLKLCMDAGLPPKLCARDPKKAADAIPPTVLVHTYFEAGGHGYVVALFSEMAAEA